MRQILAASTMDVYAHHDLSHLAFRTELLRFYICLTEMGPMTVEVLSGCSAAPPIAAICKAGMRHTARAYFFIFKASDDPERFTTEDCRHGVNFRCYTKSSASVRHFEKTSHLRRAIPEYRAIGARIYSWRSQGQIRAFVHRSFAMRR